MTALDISETVIKQARVKASEAKVSVRFSRENPTSSPDLGGAYPIRRDDLAALQKILAPSVEAGGLYLAVAGNANTRAPEDKSCSDA